jgi:tetraacyldisaccharide 4'-kinase
MRPPDFWNTDTLAARALSPLGALYGFATELKRNFATPYRAQARVLCVGNLTVGGTGKTPLAIALAHMLMARKERVVFLTRGYGGKLRGPVQVDPHRHDATDVGDEALLLANHAPTVVSRERGVGAALADSMSADVIVMDDGFQNFELVKDLALLVVDAAKGLGNRRLIPAGPLREKPEDGFSRADAVILVGDGDPDLAPFAGPVFRAHLLPNAPEALRNRPVFAFAGIGRPAKFFATLEAYGATLIGTQAFGDHHVYSSFELTALRAAASASGALLVTTEKDYVRIAPDARSHILPLPIHAAFAENAGLDSLLNRLRTVER